MNKLLNYLAALTIIIVCFAHVSLAQNDEKFKELPNFHKVNANLYRGAQPKAGGIQKLAQLGIKTIINLRGDDENARTEEKEAQAAGLRYFNVPLNNFFQPSDEEVKQLMIIINTAGNEPVFVHCKRGADRTGTVIAIYRIEHDGWTDKKAKSEADNYGMGFWQIEMKRYIRKYYKHHKFKQESLPTLNHS